MDQPLYQNFEMNNPNPLAPENPTPAPKLSLPKNPKIIILLVLIVMIIILGLISLFTTSLRQQSPTIKSKPTASPVSPIPTLNDQNIPPIYRDQFHQIIEEIQTEETFLPPQIDTDIGL